MKTYGGGSASPTPDPLPTASLGHVLLYLVPDARFTYENEDYATIVWEGPGQKPSLAQVDAARDAATTALRAPLLNRAAIRQDIANAAAGLRTYRALST